MKKVNKMFKMPWGKTNQKEVFDWIVRFQKLSNGEIPRGRLLARVFGISGERGSQYIKAFKKKVNRIKNNK